MPWRREEVAPYCYEDRYIPDTHEKIYYSWVERTPQERDELYHRMNNIPYDDAPEEREPDNSWSIARPYDSGQPSVPPRTAEPEDDGKIHVMKPIRLKGKKAAGGPNR